MKRKTLQIAGIIIIFFTLQACKAKKGGCGLTSDAIKLEQQIHQENLVSSTIK